MLISHQHKFIFIHVHKTGGNSIKLALRQVINPPEILLSNFFPCHTKAKDLGSYEELIRGNFQSQENLSLANRKVLTMLQKKIEQNSSVSVFDRLSTANYFKFAFVRNPWTHQVSLYNHILRNPNHFQYQVVKKLGNFNNYLD
ncbi:MAG: sulfotransferase family 2 domain-containing protein [Oscillatoria sp. PMC 1076.18]|nr:sulfotransferase family 2 domain-containing protein [Oscillatoria sp. PMC 1076.18]